MSPRETSSTVFLLHHVRESDDTEDVKLIGVFRNRETARLAREAVRDKPGFRSFPTGFSIDECQLDRMSWTEGFGFDDDPAEPGPLQRLAACVDGEAPVTGVFELRNPDLANPVGVTLELGTAHYS